MPLQSDLHVNRPLTNISTAYMQQQSNFIADRVFPVVPVQKQSDLYYTYPRDAWYRGDAKLRGPHAESAGGDWTVETDQYHASVYAFHVDIDDQERGNAESVFNLDRDGTEFATHQVLVKRDVEWANSYFATGVWGTDIAGVAATPGAGQTIHWDDYTGSDPISDIQAQAEAMAQLTGFMPNTLVLGPQVFRALRNHPDILERIKYTQTGMITEGLIASLFGVDRVMVPRAIRNEANEGAALDMNFIYGKSALLTYAAPRPSMKMPSAGYTFKWAGLPGASGAGIRTRRFRMEHLTSDRIEVEDTWDMKVVGADLGVFFADIVS